MSARPRRGFALLAVLWVIAGLAALALGVSLAAREAVASAHNRNDLVRAQWRAEECVEQARAIIAAAMAGGEWRRLDKVVAAATHAHSDCEVIMRAAGTRLDVNTIDADALGVLLGRLGVPVHERDSLTDALLDWRDRDDDPRPNGAERGWYLSRGLPVPRNGPLADVRELRRVRGFDRVHGLDSLLGTENERIALEHAPLAVLAALPGFSPEAVSRVAELRARGESIGDLIVFAGGLSPNAKDALLARYSDLAARTTVDPDAFTADLDRHRRLAGGARGDRDSPRSVRRARRDRSAAHVGAMSASIGLAVASDELRAVLVRDGTVLWAGRSGRTADAPLPDQVRDLLAQAPARRWMRPRVTGAVGASASQVKRIEGLPPVSDAAALALIVREGAGRFFMRNGIPLETSGVRPVEAGAAWAAAFERPIIAQIEAGSRAAGLRVRAIVPAVVALARANADAHAQWDDGDCRIEFTVSAGELRSVRRIVAGNVPELPSVPAALASLGDDGWRFADAYGASLVPDSEPLAIRPRGAIHAEISRRRLTIAAAACVLAAFLAAAAPGIGAAIDRARAEREFAQLSPHVRAAAVSAEELHRMTRALAESNALAASRRSPTALIAALALALGSGSALVTLRADSAGGMLVLLAPHAARAIAALDSVPGLIAPEIVGPVTREVMGKSEVERVTVRFRLVPVAAK